MNALNLNLFDENMERAILSTILLDKDAFSEIYDLMTPSDFYIPGHAEIYEAMRKCSQLNEPIELGFIKKHLSESFSNETLSAVISTNAILDVRKYAKELKDKSIKRSLISIAAKIPNKVSDDKPANDVVDDISAEIYDLVEFANSGVIKETPEIIENVMAEYEAIKERGNGLIGLDTGYSELNSKTKGFKEGDLIVIAARSGMGKTTFALNLVEKILKQDKGVVFFSLEMSATQIMFRLLSSLTSINLQDIMSANLDDIRLSRLSDACDAVKRMKLFVYDNRGVSLHQVRTQMLKLKRSHPEISLCVIDYIGLMDVSANYKERHLQIAEISRGLKLLARELEIPIIVLAQLNRGVEARSNHRPMLSDLRESGAIEQDADLILFVYRNDFYLEQESKEKAAKARAEGLAVEPEFKAKEIEQAEIIIGKNRSGPTGTMNFIFEKSCSRFVSGANTPVSVNVSE